jgi:hypothetical protein
MRTRKCTPQDAGFFKGSPLLIIEQTGQNPAMVPWPFPLQSAGLGKAKGRLQVKSGANTAHKTHCITTVISRDLR